VQDRQQEGAGGWRAGTRWKITGALLVSASRSSCSCIFLHNSSHCCMLPANSWFSLSISASCSICRRWLVSCSFFFLAILPIDGYHAWQVGSSTSGPFRPSTRMCFRSTRAQAAPEKFFENRILLFVISFGRLETLRGLAHPSPRGCDRQRSHCGCLRVWCIVQPYKLII
jgi:hypothetical protein